MIQKVELEKKSLLEYKGITDNETLSEIEKLAKDLKGLKVIDLNSAQDAGGVAELISSFVPLLNDIGITANWYIGRQETKFFAITKQIHNFLQGKKGDLPKEDQDLYLNTNKEISKSLSKLDTDILVVHDPQFAASISFNDDLHPAIWRCHIDTSHPNPKVWQFLLPFLQKYDRYIFHMRKYLGSGLSFEKAKIFPFAIDPLSPKNNPLERSAADQIVSRFGLDPKKPLVSQISRFDPWKDPWGVIDAYRTAKKEFPDLQLALIGSFSPDDPEENTIVRELRDYSKSDPNIFILSNLDGVHHLEVNAFQVASDVVVQKSTREGFGMTVSEAMWKGKPVIGGKAGGIVAQIVDGESGFLVTTAAETAEKIAFLLKNPEKAKQMGDAAKKRVKEKFLITRLLLDHLRLYKELAQ